MAREYALVFRNSRTGKSTLSYERFTSMKKAQEKADAWNTINSAVIVTVVRVK